MNTNNPAYLLDVSLYLDKVSFEQTEHNLTGGIDDLINLANVCKLADKLFSGNKIVTNKGYLIDIVTGEGYINDKIDSLINHNINQKKARLDILKNKKALWNLKRVMEGEKEWEDIERVILEYNDKTEQPVKADGKKLYLPLVRAEYTHS